MTNEQKQCLLLYLGYYTGKVDGIWGSKSTAATKDFQKDNNLTPNGVFGSATQKKAIAHVGAGTGFKKTASATNTASTNSTKGYLPTSTI